MSNISLLSLLALLAVACADEGLQMLPRRGKQERAICSAEGKCFKRVVTCPAECATRKSQHQACIVDCTVACTALCKTPKPYKTWCKKTTYESLCGSIVQSDPRDRLKMNPQGLVVILVSAAQAKANATRTLIYKALKNRSNDFGESNEVLKECLLAYSLAWIRSSLSVDIKRVKDQKRCTNLNDLLYFAADKVTYDCESLVPSNMSLALSVAIDNTASFSSIIDITRRILSFIGCGPYGM